MENNNYGIKGILKELKEKRISTISASWVFYFVLAIIPIFVLLLIAFSFFNVEIAGLKSILPNETMSLLNEIFITASDITKGFTVFFLISVIYSCAKLIQRLSFDGQFIYDVNKNIKQNILKRILAVISVFVLFIIFILIAFLLSYGKNFISGLLNGNSYVNYIFIFSFTFIVSYGIIILLNIFIICPQKIKLKEVILGSFISLFIIVLGTIAFTFYLRLIDGYNAFYGSLASIFVFMLWSYIVMYGLVFGAIINSIIHKRGKIYVKNTKSNQDLRQKGKSGKQLVVNCK